MKKCSIKALLIGLTAVCALALAGCGSGSADNDTAKKAANNTTTTTTTAEIAGPATTTTTTTVETTAEPETETTTAAEQSNPEMMTVEECVRKLVSQYTDAEITRFKASSREIQCVTEDKHRFMLAENGTGIMNKHETGEKTNINDYRVSEPMETLDGALQYSIIYEPAE